MKKSIGAKYGETLKSNLIVLVVLVLGMYTVTVAANATITVIAPNGGGKLYAGASTNITWTSTGNIDSVKIHLTIDNGANWDLVATDVPNTGTYAWTVPEVSSEECKIRVGDVKQGGPYDMSDSTFIIDQLKKIEVTSPNGGESLKVGTRHQIRWSTIGLIDSVKVELSKDNGDSWMVFTSKTPNTGAFQIYVPDLVTEKCLVRVSSSADESIKDISDAPFSIYNPNNSIKNSIGNFKAGNLVFLGSNQVTGAMFMTIFLVKQEQVLVEIYTLRGKPVTCLVNERKNAGRHTVLWNNTNCAGRKVPNGTYCTRVQIGSKAFARKVTVLR